MRERVRTLRSGFLASAERFPDREALAVGNASITYAELDRRARRIAATLDRHAGSDEGKLTAVLGHRHPTAPAAILGALYRGHGYVPLNPMFPMERTRAMLTRSRCRSIVVDATASDQLDALLADLHPPRVVLVPDRDDVREIAARNPAHRILGGRDLEPAERYVLRSAGPDGIAYLLFTSGSTGQPKGVMVAHRNVTAFLDLVTSRYGIGEGDRLSNTFDLTFDLSVFDLFAAWERGASVSIPTAREKLFPGRYVKQQRLTIWFSVPSTGVLMSRLKMLEPAAYPTLRWALFCGEALPVEVVERFLSAAPNAVAENLYGPTELTIACTLHRWDPRVSPAHVRNGLVPIGEPFEGMAARVVDESLAEVPRGTPGELLMTGPQMTLGYFEDEERTRRAFVEPDGDGRVFYRTGDRVVLDPRGPLVYLGRVDNQLKIQGYRVELGEVEAVLRGVTGSDIAVAVGWPRTAIGADGVVGFVLGQRGASVDRWLAEARARLPSYMQPSRIVVVDDFALNANGKVDRGALLASLEAE